VTLNVTVSEQLDNVLIRIDDNGKGIKNDLLPHIFERFYKVQVDEHIADDIIGTGLGLAIVKEIVQGHQGDIWVKSKLNEGSRFYITLPIEAAIEETVPPTGTAGPM